MDKPLSIVPDSFQNDFIQIYQPNVDSIRTEISAGLRSDPAFISPKFLYDNLGSKLFESICELPEYYLTRTEAEILKSNLFELRKSVGKNVTLIDLGAGNCAKASQLFSAFQPVQYIPVDISVDFLKDAVQRLQDQYPHVQMTGLGIDFSSALSLPDVVRSEKRLFFYPGSSIGNFNPDEALEFLKNIRGACGSDGSLLIGVDLIKDPSILDAAYDDALGVTAAFNLNMLRHLNVLLNADFKVQNWRHRGYFNSELNRIEMHLEAKCPVEISWNGGSRKFSAGERIHTESSYKYTKESFLHLLEQSGFSDVRCWTDPQSYFLVCHAKVAYEH